MRSTLSQPLIWQLSLDLSRHRTPVGLLSVDVSEGRTNNARNASVCPKPRWRSRVFLLMAIFRILQRDVISGVVQP